MPKKIFLILIFILFLGIGLRYSDLYKYPRHGATFDEFAWTWLGINLIQNNVPISWSPHPQYKDRKEIKYQGAAFLLVKPYLEHPPLFGLVAGSFAMLNGAKDMYDVTLEKIRPLSLILGAVSMVAVFLLTKELYGNLTAFLSVALYATVPTIVIGSRIVQNENFLIPFWLLSLYLVTKYLKSGKKKFRNFAIIIAGLLSLAKVPWLVVGLSVSMILSYKGKWKDAFLVGGITLAIFSLYMFYGFYFDKNLFVDLLKLQTARYDISFSGFFSIFTEPLLADRFYLDGWIIFGWFSIFFLAREFEKYYMILIPFVAYLILYIFAIPNEPAHGWYRFPFYPFLIMSSALVLKEEFKKISLMSFLFILMVGLSLLSNTWQENFGFSYILYRSFIVLASASIFFVLWKIKKSKLPITFVWITFFIILNIWSVLTYVE
jgi:4-amino-4-deoxy-L-arabinose transferase-like glycosyltransferase